MPAKVLIAATHYDIIIGLSQQQLAERLGVTKNTVLNWEQDRSLPDILSMQKISELFGVKFEDFFSDDIGEPITQTPIAPVKKTNLFVYGGLTLFLVIFTLFIVEILYFASQGEFAFYYFAMPALAFIIGSVAFFVVAYKKRYSKKLNTAALILLCVAVLVFYAVFLLGVDLICVHYLNTNILYILHYLILIVLVPPLLVMLLIWISRQLRK